MTCGELQQQQAARSLSGTHSGLRQASLGAKHGERVLHAVQLHVVRDNAAA